MRIKVYPLVALLIVSAGCGHDQSSAAPGKPEASQRLAAFLPTAPEGWRTEQPGTEDALPGAGTHAWAIYEPEPGNREAEGIHRVELTISQVADDASEDQERKLRRLPSTGAQFLEQIEVAGLPAWRSAPIYSEHILSVEVGPRLWVDIVVYSRPPDDANRYQDAETREQTGQLFAGRINFEDLKKLAPESTRKTGPSEETFRLDLRGKWVGDVEAYKSAHPDDAGAVGETLHRTIE